MGLGNTELAGSQVTKHSAPDSQLGQMAGLQHHGTNMHEDGEEEGEAAHHTRAHTGMSQCSLRRVAKTYNLSLRLKSLYETWDSTLLNRS